MATFILAMGIRGAGKSAYLRQHYPKAHVFSWESYPKEQSEEAIFSSMCRDIEAFLRENSHAQIACDATNLNRKRRMILYALYKKYVDGQVVTLLFFANPKESGEEVGQSVRFKEFKTLQVPRVGVDCDEVRFLGTKWFKGNSLETAKRAKSVVDIASFAQNQEIKEMILQNITPHDTPYHLESVDEHIRMVIENAPEKLKLTAIFHDLGKGVVKDGGHYHGHDLVSAQLLANFLYSNGCTCFCAEMEDIERVYQHMNAHFGFKQQTLRKHRLEHLIQSVEEFAKIDEQSRIVGEGIRK